MSDNYEPGTNFQAKHRIIKEKTSLAGGFRIPEEHLKKRVNPSDEIQISSSPAQNRPHSTFSFNPLNSGKSKILTESQNPKSINLIIGMTQMLI